MYANAKMLCKYFNYDVDALLGATKEELSEIEGIGEVIASAYVAHMEKEENMRQIREVLAEVTIEQAKALGEQTMDGMSFCITGSLNHYGRNELKEIIENKGGKVTGSVTSKTKVLINNDITSNSSKNKKAKELGVEILTEDDFIAQYLQ